MRAWRVRFSLWKLLVVVAVVALAFAGEATRRRWVSLGSVYRKKATSFKEKASSERFGSGVAAGLSNDQEKRKHEQTAEQYDALARKYERAARFPWLPVAPNAPGKE
jgi:hypothetical protein